MLAVTLTIEWDGKRSDISRTAPGTLSWQSRDTVRPRLSHLLAALHGDAQARAILRRLRRDPGIDFLKWFRPVGSRAARPSFPTDFTIFAVIDELSFGVEDAPFLFTPSADVVERLQAAGHDGRAFLRALADRINSGIAGRPCGPDERLDPTLAAIGSPGPWQVAMRRDRRPMASRSWEHHQTDTAEIYDRSGRRLAAVWRQHSGLEWKKISSTTAFETFVWSVAGAAGAGDHGRGAIPHSESWNQGAVH